MRYILLLLLLLLPSSLYANDSLSAAKADTAVIEGTFSQVSKLPAAAGNPYPDCYYTATLDLHHIVSGRSIPRRIVLVLPGFFSRKYAPEANYKVGDKVRAVVVPFASMPEKVRQTQQADEVEDVDLEFFYAKEIAPIADFQTVPRPIPFAGKSKNDAEVILPHATDPKAKAARREAMQRDLDEINKLLAKHGGDWDKWYDSLKGYREEYKKAYEAKAQRWVGNSFFSAGQIQYGKGYSPDFVKTVIAFNKYLADRNVDLILVRVPQKGEIVDDLFTSIPPDQVYNPYLLRMYKELLEADVEIVTDVVPRIKEARLNYPLMYYYQDFPEEHPAEGTSWVVAELLAKRLNRYEKLRTAPKEPLKLGRASLPQESFHWPEGNAKFTTSDPVNFASIHAGEKDLLRLKQGNDSPILVVGSSFIGSPSMELMGNIPSYLAYLTGVIPDILYRNGSNATIPRTIAREGDGFLKNRAVCVFPLVPWAIHLPLDLPPVVDPAKVQKALLASYTGEGVKSHISFSDNTPRKVYSYAIDGALTIQGRDKQSRIGGVFNLALPHEVSRYPYVMIEIDSESKDAATIKGKYGTQTDTVHKSYSQPNTEDNFVFKSGGDESVQFDVSNLKYDTPLVIKAIKVFGLQP